MQSDINPINIKKIDLIMYKQNKVCLLVSYADNFANSLDPDQARQNVELIWIKIVCHSDGISERIFQKLI